MALEITLNGEARRLDVALSVRGLLESLGLDPAKIAVERNLEIVPRSTYGEVALAHGDRLGPAKAARHLPEPVLDPAGAAPLASLHLEEAQPQGRELLGDLRRDRPDLGLGVGL